MARIFENDAIGARVVFPDVIDGNAYVRYFETWRAGAGEDATIARSTIAHAVAVVELAVVATWQHGEDVVDLKVKADVRDGTPARLLHWLAAVGARLMTEETNIPEV